MVHSLLLLRSRQLRNAIDDLPALHQQWLDAYGGLCAQGWASGPQDGYFFSQLTRHLKAAGQLNELRSLLFDYNWLMAQLQASGINGLLADYDWLTEDKALRLVQSTLRLSAHVLVTKPNQLTARLWGHLRDRDQPEFETLLEQAASQHTHAWLQPQQAKLAPPDGALLRTFSDHSSWVMSVVLSGDGRYALSGSYDNTLKLWDVTTGEALRTFSGHSGGVNSVVLSGDGRYALSGSYDNTLKLWDVISGDCLATFCGDHSFYSCDLADDGVTIAAGTVHFFSVVEPEGE